MGNRNQRKKDEKQMEEHLIEVKRQLKDNENFTEDESNKIVKELIRGLICKDEMKDYKFPFKLSFPTKIDLAWHYAILNTEMYKTFCDTFFNEFINHSTTTNNDTAQERNNRILKTMECYKKIFREHGPKDLWFLEEEDIKVETNFDIIIKIYPDKILNLEVSENHLVKNLKEMIHKNGYANPEHQRLIYSGKDLSDNQFLKDCGIQAGSTVHQLLKLRGC